MNHSSHHARLQIAAAAAWLLIAARPAPASQLDEEKTLASAEQACLSGAYQRGVDILASLYIATRKPAYIHNQARCYEQNAQYEAAHARYVEYLRQVKELPPERQLPPERRAQIEASMARLEQAIARQRSGAAYGGATAAAPAPGGPPTPPPSGLPGTTAAPGGYPGYSPAPTTAGAPAGRQTWPPGPADVAARRNRPAATGGNPALRIVGPVAVGLGGVLVLGAALAGARANSLASEVADDAKRNQQYDASKFDSGKSAATLATIGFIAGPVLIGGGALLYWLGLPKTTKAAGAPAPRSVSVMPGLLAGGASLHLGVVY
jgi:hypothetical protein